MLEQHPAFLEPLGPRRPHELLSEDFEEAAPREPCDGGGHPGAQRQCGKDEAARGTNAPCREPAQTDGEHVDEQKAQEKRRRADPCYRDHCADIVRHRVAPDGLKEANAHPRQDRKSTRLTSHHSISYAVFCLKKKKTIYIESVASVNQKNGTRNKERSQSSD